MILNDDFIDTIGGYKFKYNQATIRDVLEYDDFIINQGHSIVDWLLLFLEEHYVVKKRGKYVKKFPLDEDFKIDVILEREKVFKHLNKYFFIGVEFGKDEEQKEEQRKLDTNNIMSILSGKQKKEVERAKRPLVSIVGMVVNYYHVNIVRKNNEATIWDMSWEEIFHEEKGWYFAMIFNLNEQTEEGREHNLKIQKDKEYEGKKDELIKDYQNLKKYLNGNKRSKPGAQSKF